MRNALRHLLPAVAGSLPLLAAIATAGEVLIHRGTEVKSPGLGPEEELVFRREFFVDETLLDAQPDVVPDSSGEIPLDAQKALKLALDSVDTGDGPGVKTVTCLRLLGYRRAGGPPRNVAFYHIGMLADGSGVERVVLMDGSVVASRLREVKK